MNERNTGIQKQKDTLYQSVVFFCIVYFLCHFHRRSLSRRQQKCVVGFYERVCLCVCVFEQIKSKKIVEKNKSMLKSRQIKNSNVSFIVEIKLFL